MGHAVWLKDRGVVRVAGADAASFLQGLITNDVEKLTAGGARYAALLSPQGKILFDFLVLRLLGEDGFLIDCAATQSADLAKRLGFYKLRAKVTVSDVSAEHGVIAAWGESAAGFVDPRGLGLRRIAPRAEAQAVGEADLPAYEALRISLGVPKGGVDFAYNDAYPHEANLDALAGVDFKKGCYVGQEVVSRMQHRATVKKRVLRVELDGPAPEPGTPVLDGEVAVGSLGGAAGSAALALLRLDRVEEAVAAGRILRAAGVAVKPV